MNVVFNVILIISNLAVIAYIIKLKIDRRKK